MLQTLLTLPPTNKGCVYLLWILNTGRCTGVGSRSWARHYRFLTTQKSGMCWWCQLFEIRNKESETRCQWRTSPDKSCQWVNHACFSWNNATITLSLEHEFPHAVGPQHCQDSWYVEDALPAVQLQHDGSSSSDHQSAEKCHQDGPKKK